MDSNCSRTITGSCSCDDHEERREPMIGSDRDYINCYTSLPSIQTTNEQGSRPDPYSPNSSGKQVITKKGRSRKYWPESREYRQNMYDHLTRHKPKHDGQIPSLALATQPRNEQCQDLRDKPLSQRNDYFPKSKPAPERYEETRHLERIESPRVRKQAGSRGVDIPPSEPRHSLCSENNLCYPTRTQIGSAFTPARGQCYRPYCHGNTQKYSEPYFLPCYPFMIPEEQVPSPRLDRDICYHNTQLSNYSLAKQMTAKSSPKNPIIIDCFSLAMNGNNAVKVPLTGVNQETTVTRYPYEEEEDKETGNNSLDPNKFQHNCMICQQIATGDVLPQLCNTSNKCCYQTNQPNSRCTASSTGNSKDESPESCWDDVTHDTNESEDQQRKPRSPVGFKRKHEEPDSQEAIRTMTEDRGTVVNSAFSTPKEKKSKSNVYESNLQVVSRQESRVSPERELLDADDTRESLADHSNELSCHPSHYYTSTNTAPLYSPDSMTEVTRNSLQRKWEAMYDILEDPADKTNKKSYFCSHCGRAFTHLSSLNNHIRTHTGQKPFRCRYCGKRFAQSGVLTAHLRTHTGEKPFNCVLCGKSFAQTTTLANHIRTHTGQKPFSCRYCKRTFAQSSTRNKHELSHTKEKPFECKYCGRSFTQSATVMRHMRIHMRDTKYSCIHCGKTFAYLYSLDKHLDEHT